MCDNDILFCFFYYLGYLSIAAAFTAGMFIISDWLKRKQQEQEKKTDGTH